MAMGSEAPDGTDAADARQTLGALARQDAMQQTAGLAPQAREFVAAWSDKVLRELPIPVRAKWRGGQWALVRDDVAVFVVPNEWHKSACEDTRKDVEKQLWVLDIKPEKVEIRTEDEFVSGKSTDTESSPESAIGAALGPVILTTRKKLKLSQRQLGERVGVDQSVISSWERGAVTPSIDRLFNLDMAFGFQPGTLLARAGLIKRDSVEAGERRRDDQEAINVDRVEIATDGAIRAMCFPPALTLEQWLELARTLIIGELDRGATVTELKVTRSSDGFETSMQLGENNYGATEVLRLIEIMLDAQGSVSAAPQRAPAYDPSEEPF